MAVTEALPISVLMTTYCGEPVEHVQAALQSLFQQTRPPAEVVLVLDGTVSEDMTRMLSRYQLDNRETHLITVKLRTNRGQGMASNEGLAYCTRPWVARMDSDDISSAYRFEKQWALIEQDKTLDVIFSWQGEFVDDPMRMTAIKKAPEKHDDIYAAMRWRNVISHPSLLIRKELLEKIGGYQPLRILEDYDLCMRMFEAGGRFACVQEPLVLVRVLPAQRRRRSGMTYALTEWKVRHRFYKAKHFNFIFYIFSCIVYTIFRLQPACLKPAFYRLVRSTPKPLTLPGGSRRHE